MSEQLNDKKESQNTARDNLLYSFSEVYADQKNTKIFEALNIMADTENRLVNIIIIHQILIAILYAINLQILWFLFGSKSTINFTSNIWTWYANLTEGWQIFLAGIPVLIMTSGLSGVFVFYLNRRFKV